MPLIVGHAPHRFLDGAGLVVTTAKWFLRQNAANLAVPHDLSNDVGLLIRRDGDVDHFDTLIIQ